MLIKIVFTLSLLALLNACGSEQEKTTTNTNSSSQNLSSETTDKTKASTIIAGRPTYALFSAFKSADIAKTRTLKYKVVSACKTPTEQDPTILLEASEHDGANSHRVKIEGTSTKTELYFDLGDGLTYQGVGNILPDSEEEPGFHLSIPPAEGSKATTDLTITGAFYCKQA